jgi:hypothetical protein
MAKKHGVRLRQSIGIIASMPNRIFGTHRDIVRLISRYAPAESWGSVEKVEHWIEQGGLKGHKDLEDGPNLQHGEDLGGQHDA